MKNWKKTSLLTTLIIALLITGAFYLLNLKVIGGSSGNIEFSPGTVASLQQPDSIPVKPKNIIVFIADGMGFGHLSMAMQTQQSEDTPSVWQEFDVRGWHDARSGYGPLTDSEASATAMATGTSTSFGYMGVDSEGNSLKTVLELAAEANYNTGIVTDSYIWDGTPAAFATHGQDEDDARDIMTQMASGDLDILFGELEDLGEDDVPEEEETMEILKKRFLILNESLELPQPTNGLTPIAAIYDEDEVQDLSSTPNLTQLTELALEYITTQDDPFVLLVECEELDSASHTNDSERVLKGIQSIQETLSHILSFSEKNGETLVLFTADHETGGLAAVADFGSYPDLQIRWTTKDHTAAVVPLFADGPGAEYFYEVQRNSHIGSLLKSLIEMP